jgi:hypothetical protein
MEECDISYGKQKVDWVYFINTVILVGVFISVLSSIICIASMIGGFANASFFIGFILFGMTISAEGILASVFEVR